MPAKGAKKTAATGVPLDTSSMEAYMASVPRVPFSEAPPSTVAELQAGLLQARAQRSEDARREGRDGLLDPPAPDPATEESIAELAQLARAAKVKAAVEARLKVIYAEKQAASDKASMEAEITAAVKNALAVDKATAKALRASLDGKTPSAPSLIVGVSPTEASISKALKAAEKLAAVKVARRASLEDARLSSDEESDSESVQFVPAPPAPTPSELEAAQRAVKPAKTRKGTIVEGNITAAQLAALESDVEQAKVNARFQALTQEKDALLHAKPISLASPPTRIKHKSGVRSSGSGRTLFFCFIRCLFAYPTFQVLGSRKSPNAMRNLKRTPRRRALVLLPLFPLSTPTRIHPIGVSISFITPRWFKTICRRFPILSVRAMGGLLWQPIRRSKPSRLWQTT